MKEQNHTTCVFHYFKRWRFSFNPDCTVDGASCKKLNGPTLQVVRHVDNTGVCLVHDDDSLNEWKCFKAHRVAKSILILVLTFSFITLIISHYLCVWKTTCVTTGYCSCRVLRDKSRILFAWSLNTESIQLDVIILTTDSTCDDMGVFSSVIVAC